MKRIKILMSCVVVMALALTACDDPNMTLVPTESTTETVVTTETDEAEVTPTPAISGTPTPTIAPTGSTTTASSVADGTEATTTEAGSDSGNTSSGSGNTSGGGSSSGGSEGGNASGGSNGGSSGGGSAPTTTTQATETTAAPTEATTTTVSSKYVKGVHCGSCGNETLVENAHYRYTTPEKTHEETTETWDYGIQHCEVQINWKSNAKDLGNPPSITISFDRKVDTSGKPYDNNAENDATSKAMDKADEWLRAQGVENCSGYYSWQTNKGSTDKINYNKTTTTVVDEPAHEYECAAYVCDSCGAVEIVPGTEKKIR